MLAVTVSKRGGVVIPAEIRKRLGIHPGDHLQVADYGGQIVLLRSVDDPTTRLRGFLKGGPSLTDALLEDRREEREREEAKINRWSPGIPTSMPPNI